jgi:hypothetical protein
LQFPQLTLFQPNKQSERAGVKQSTLGLFQEKEKRREEKRTQKKNPIISIRHQAKANKKQRVSSNISMVGYHCISRPLRQL